MKKQTYLFIIVLLLATILRLVLLNSIPIRVDGDSSRFALDGLRIWKEKAPFFGTGWQAHTNAYFYFVGFFLRIFNNNQLLTIRTISAIGGILSIISTYLLTKKLFNFKIAIWTIFVLSILPFHLVFSRIGLEGIWMTFFVTLSIYLIISGKNISWFLSGIVVGISQYFTPVSRLIPILIFLFLIIKILANKSYKHLLLKIFLWLTGFVMIYLFQIKYFLLFPNNYLSRLNQVSILNKTYVNPSYLLTQLYNCFLVFHLPVRSSALWFSSPYLDPLMAFFFTIGLLLMLSNFKKWQYIFIFLSLVIGIFLGGVITDDSPMPSRYIIIIPIVAIFIGLGIKKFMNLAKINESILSIIIIFVLTSTSFYSYWKREVVDFSKADRNSQISTYVGRYFMKVPNNYDIYFIGDENLSYNSIPAIPFLLKKSDGIDMPTSVEEYFNRNTLNKNKRNYFIVINTRQNEIQILVNKFPKIKIKKISNQKGDTLFWILEN